jgi:hypothetical protein
MASLLPPVVPTAGVDVLAPSTNLSTKLGVPFNPLHNTHPVGIAAAAPDHNIMPPVGMLLGWPVMLLKSTCRADMGDLTVTTPSDTGTKHLPNGVPRGSPVIVTSAITLFMLYKPLLNAAV